MPVSKKRKKIKRRKRMNKPVQRGGGPLGNIPMFGQGKGPVAGPMPQLDIDINQCPDVLCPECGGEAWQQALLVKKVPKLLTGGQGPDKIQLGVLMCCNPKCLHLLKPEEFDAVGTPAKEDKADE